MTAPSPADKIVDISARLNGGRGVTDHNQLLATLKTRAFRYLGGVVAGVLEKADDTLFDFVQRADGSLGQQEYFDAMRELRRQRAVVEKRFHEHLLDAFAALERRAPMQMHFEHSTGHSGELSLVSEEQLEEQLGSSQVASALARQFRPLLEQINYRMGVLSQVPDLNDHGNPIGPSHLAQAFRLGLQGCEITIRARVLLLKLYERETMRALPSFYNEVNRAMVDAGIAPNIRPTYARVPNAAPQGSTPAASPAASHGAEPEAYPPGASSGAYQEAPRYVRTPETAAEQSIFASLHELLSGYRRSQHARSGFSDEALHQFDAHDGEKGEEPSASGNEDDGRTINAEEMLSVLSMYQNEMPDSLADAVADPNASITQYLKQEVLKGAEKLGLGDGARITPADEDAIDLVGMLFDVMLEERDFDSNSRKMMGRLIMPFVKVAMLDRRMFLQKTHPARRLLNSLAEASEGNAGETPQEREMMSRVDRTIDRLIAEFNEDIAIFETLEQEFREFIEQHRKRVALAERRTAEAQRGKERLEHARSQAMDELRAVLGRYPDLPAPIEAFLRRYWTHHLTLCALREEGGDRTKYALAVAAGEGLAALGMLNASAPERLRHLQAMRPRLEPVLVSAGCVGSAADDVMASLAMALEHGGQQMPGEVSEAIVALARNAPNAEALPIETAAPSDAAEEDPAEQLEFDEADVERIRKLEVGRWIQFTEADGTAQPAKLSWISPISSRMLFVNRRGMRYCVVSPEELAAMMGQGKVNIRQSDTAFEHAMAQVLGKLRSTPKPDE